MTLSAAPEIFACGEKRDRTNYGNSQSNMTAGAKIGKRSLTEIRDTFRQEVVDNNIPVWNVNRVDWKHGGYLIYFDKNGALTSTDKRLYHQGRILWLYSYFYNHFGGDENHLRAAKCGYDFLVRYGLRDDGLWNSRLDREGNTLIGYEDIFACIYTTLGLGEYYNVTGITEVRDLAVKSAYRIMETITSNSFQAPGHGPYYDIITSYREPGTRRLGIWMHFLSALTPLLKYTEDPGLEVVARACVRNMLKYHYQPDMGLAYEFLDRDYKPYPKSYLNQDYYRAVDGFHSIETAWMCMDEALRVGSPQMFKDAMELGRNLLEKCWLERDGVQGLVRYYWPDEDDPFERSKVLTPYVMNEVFIFLLLVLEHDPNATWASEWFDKAFSYSYETPIKFPYGETLHHPRGCMFSIEILDRMIARNGKASNFFDKA